jgi:hypothetical protein
MRWIKSQNALFQQIIDNEPEMGGLRGKKTNHTRLTPIALNQNTGAI